MKAKERLVELKGLMYNRNASSYASIQKAVYKEAEEEEDCDMGFGLFD